MHRTLMKPVGYVVMIPIILAATAGLWAGGPRLVSAPRWQSPVTYRLDPGPLRSGSTTFNHQQGAQLVEDAFAGWTGISTVDLQVVNEGNLPVDVDSTNFDSIVSNPANGNPVVFDGDGKIIEAMTGSGSGGTVLGFATGRDTDGDGIQDFGLAVLNGSVVNTVNPGSSFVVTVIHELGHMLGLDHTQAGAENFASCSGLNPDACAAVPVMYPFIRGGVGNNLNGTPLADDRAWMSWLYPAADFASTTGTIKGHVQRRQGVPFQGANVVAIRVNPQPAGAALEDPADRVSLVSDGLGSLDGSFELVGLPPGNYVVRIESLQPGFTEGSGVGPFETRFTDFSSPDYYNGANESGEEGGTVPADERQIISVAAGQVVAGIDFVSDDNSDSLPRSDLATIQDDDSRTIFFPPGFSFPFFGKTYRAVYVNSDGNLSFEGGQETVGRREAEFLNGPPRIAPLFTDLNPAESGMIRAEMDGDALTITWDQVPEFSGSGGRPPNTFSVTLFANGDVRFRYQDIQILPDGPTQAVVGLTPGRTSGTAIDLSSQSGPIPYQDAPVFQTFVGFSFDLANSELFFQAATHQFFFNFPLVQADGDTFTGIAVSNDSATTAQLVVESLAQDGTRQNLPVNPGQAQLGPGQQLARLSTEFFGLRFSDSQDGWIQIGSNTDQLSSFFQIGNGLAGPTTRLDGSVAITAAANRFYFTRLFDGSNSFITLNGLRPATTTLALANPGSGAVTATLSLFNSMGQMQSQATRQLAAGGCLAETLASLFGSEPVREGFVQVDVTGDGAVGFELIRVGDSLAGLNASLGNPQTVSYSAQLAHGTSGATQIFTSIKLINTSTEPRAVTLTALDEQGTVIRVAGPFTLQPNSSFERDAGMVFSLGPALGPAVAGSLRVDATGGGVIGDVVFGDPNDARYLAALPLQSMRFSRAVFSQVANRMAAAASASTFTGLAFHNPGSSAADIQVRVFRQDGSLSGQAQITLPAGGRMSEVLATLAPATRGQERGFIEVVSDVPIILQQLFGNLTLDFLSAVPPSLATP